MYTYLWMVVFLVGLRNVYTGLVINGTKQFNIYTQVYLQ